MHMSLQTYVLWVLPLMVLLSGLTVGLISSTFIRWSARRARRRAAEQKDPEYHI
jgi:cytochrome c-type biogenesis protein CcmH/NrfF